jgi:hypothetical protein
MLSNPSVKRSHLSNLKKKGLAPYELLNKYQIEKPVGSALLDFFHSFRLQASLASEMKKAFTLTREGFSICGERGIRTPGGVTLNSFQDYRIRPLCHLSNKIPYFP